MVNLSQGVNSFLAYQFSYKPTIKSILSSTINNLPSYKGTHSFCQFWCVSKLIIKQIKEKRENRSPGFLLLVFIYFIFYRISIDGPKLYTFFIGKRNSNILVRFKILKSLPFLFLLQLLTFQFYTLKFSHEPKF